jgi:hypothetical protein
MGGVSLTRSLARGTHALGTHAHDRLTAAHAGGDIPTHKVARVGAAQPSGAVEGGVMHIIHSNPRFQSLLWMKSEV